MMQMVYVRTERCTTSSGSRGVHVITAVLGLRLIDCGFLGSACNQTFWPKAPWVVGTWMQDAVGPCSTTAYRVAEGLRQLHWLMPHAQTAACSSAGQGVRFEALMPT